MDVCCYHEMSSNDDSNIEQFIRRFELYCDGALKCYKDVPNEFLMASNILLRAIKVGIKHKTLRFTIIAMQKYMRFSLNRISIVSFCLFVISISLDPTGTIFRVKESMFVFAFYIILLSRNKESNIKRHSVNTMVLFTTSYMGNYGFLDKE